MRFKHSRDIYIPKGAIKVSDKQSSAVVYLAPSRSPRREHYPFAMMAFQGKAQKPEQHFIYPTEAKRWAAVDQFFSDIRGREARRAEAKAERESKGRGLEVGNVLRASWGYDQTNINYYEVTKLVGLKMVEIREIAQESKETAWATGDCVPMPGKYIEPVMRKHASVGTVRIESYMFARRVAPVVDIGGAKAYGTSRWSASH